MKHLITPFVILALACASAWAQDDKPAGCLVAHFKGMSLRTNDAAQRAKLAEDCLRKFIGSCNKEQIAAIKSNSPDWLGTAHTHDINMIIDASFETIAKTTRRKLRVFMNLWPKSANPPPRSSALACPVPPLFNPPLPVCPPLAA